MKAFKSCNLKNEKPMTYLNIFRFFEDMMDKKFEVDNGDLAARRKPRNMTEFMIEHLNRMFGLKKLAMRHLAQIMPALNQMVNEKQLYGTLFSRLLQIFHPSPIVFPMAMYITRQRIAFNELVEKSNHDRGIEIDTKSAKKSKWSMGKTTHGQAAYDLAACGGEACCFRVLNLIYKLFE